jgi:hypothetical protein
VVVTLAAFLPTLGNGFASWDDAINLLHNPWYRGLGTAQLRLPRVCWAVLIGGAVAGW